MIIVIVVVVADYKVEGTVIVKGYVDLGVTGFTGHYLPGLIIPDVKIVALAFLSGAVDDLVVNIYQQTVGIAVAFISVGIVHQVYHCGIDIFFIISYRGGNDAVYGNTEGAGYRPGLL